MTYSLPVQQRRQIAKEYGLDASSITDEWVAMVEAEKKAAHDRWLAQKPLLIEKARIAYRDALSKGGNNAERRAIRAARAIWSGFESHMA